MSNLINKYVWLTETLRRAHKLSLEDISRKYQAYEDLSGGNPLPERTFHKWRIAAEEMFDISIRCDRTDGYRYFIEEEDADRQGLRNWLFNSISASNLLAESKQLKERIMVEDVPSGQLFLQPIIEAMKNHHQLILTYQPFGSNEPHQVTVCPYAVRLYRQRWYLLALKEGGLRTYGLDRMDHIQETGATFTFPQDFDLKDYYSGSIGVMAMEEIPVEEVSLRVSAHQANYLRTLKWDPTQEEIERTETYSIFTLKVRPTIELKQKIFQQAEAIEVLSPLWFRLQIKEAVEKLQQMYR